MTSHSSSCILYGEDFSLLRAVSVSIWPLTATGPYRTLVGIPRNPSKWRKPTFNFAVSGRSIRTPKFRNRSFNGENQLFKLAVNSAAIPVLQLRGPTPLTGRQPFKKFITSVLVMIDVSDDIRWREADSHTGLAFPGK